MKLATEDEIALAHQIGEDWALENIKFSDMLFLAIRTVAEYNLNMSGKTMFPEMVKK